MYQRLVRCRTATLFSAPAPYFSRYYIRYFATLPSTRGVSPKTIPVKSVPMYRAMSTGSETSRPRTGYSGIDGQLPRCLEILKHEMTSPEFHDSVWGFVIYRCVKGNDAAWNSLLQIIQDDVRTSFEPENHTSPIPDDILQYHDLHVVDDKKLYGASIRQVREHFREWVPRSLNSRLRPDTMIDDITRIGADTTPRYMLCLAVDQICLESLDHPGSNSPVAKLVFKDFNLKEESAEEKLAYAERYEQHTPDEGWMYMPLAQYTETYTARIAWDDWYDDYINPPFTDWCEDESHRIGHWRDKKN
ncbi:valine--tRNA ligase [Cadophora gregata]|uniref:valine--tRNA ligase n=1 Tax=Cadophora gregata TaxID=51156 RepID=UPI0026DD88D3|nr:valine--tRNA ligase [Cadophora gregata]KAK0120218.1 valine--tRNA ligase [Cadophora gregata]KAK0121251.1 valine--tRNA ligase [Cadophora gregata f. sp. sojae]